MHCLHRLNRNWSVAIVALTLDRVEEQETTSQTGQIRAASTP